MKGYLLSKDQMELTNENFGLDLQYNDAEHYWAGQVIWSLWKETQ